MAQTLAGYFPGHKFGPIQHSPQYCGDPAHPSNSTSIPTQFLPTESGVVTDIFAPPPDHVHSPLRVLAEVMREKGFRMNVPIDASLRTFYDVNQRYLSRRPVPDELATYLFYLQGYCLPAGAILELLEIPQPLWNTRSSSAFSKPDLEAEASTTGLVAQAEVKMDEKVIRDAFAELHNQASRPEGVSLDFVYGATYPFRVDLPHIDPTRQRIMAEGLAQTILQMQRAAMQFEIFTTWECTIIFYRPGPTGHVYMSPVILRDFAQPDGNTLADFLATPLGCWTAMSCLDPPLGPGVAGRLSLARRTRGPKLPSPVADPTERQRPYELRSSSSRGGGQSTIRRSGRSSSRREVQSIGQSEIQVSMTVSEIDLETAGRSLLHVFNLDSPFRGPVLLKLLPLLSDEYSSGLALPMIEPSLPENGNLFLQRAHLSLSSQIGHGRLWDAFRGLLLQGSLPGPGTFGAAPDSDEDMIDFSRSLSQVITVDGYSIPPPVSPPCPVVVKLTCPRIVQPPGEVEFPFRSYTEADNRRCVVREMQVYEKLQAHQGRDFPAIYGVYGSLQLAKGYEEVWMLVMQDCGTAMTVESMTAEDRAALLDRYHLLHSLGIVHNDPHPKHWLSSDDNRGPWIIDYEGAIFRSEVSAEQWEDRTYWEIDEVQKWLSQESA